MQPAKIFCRFPLFFPARAGWQRQTFPRHHQFAENIKKFRPSFAQKNENRNISKKEHNNAIA
jgi:hypothetical protein